MGGISAVAWSLAGLVGSLIDFLVGSFAEVASGFGAAAALRLASRIGALRRSCPSERRVVSRAAASRATTSQALLQSDRSARFEPGASSSIATVQLCPRD